MKTVYVFRSQEFFHYADLANAIFRAMGYFPIKAKKEAFRKGGHYLYY